MNGDFLVLNESTLLRQSILEINEICFKGVLPYFAFILMK
jgi:hypothetical protein